MERKPLRQGRWEKLRDDQKATRSRLFPPHGLPAPPRGIAGMGVCVCVCVALCVLAHVGVNTHGCTHGDQSSMPSVFLSISSSSWFIFGERFFSLERNLPFQ